MAVDNIDGVIFKRYVQINETNSMAVGRVFSSDSEDDDYCDSTQIAKNTLKELSDHYDHLARDGFIETIVGKMSLDGLSNIRRSLYDLALEIIPGVPRGKLIIRKDRQ